MVELVPICAVHEMSCHCSHPFFIVLSLFPLSISDVNSSQPHSEIGSISDIIFKGVLSPVGSVNASYFQYLVNQSQTEMGVSVNNVANPDVKLLKGMHRRLNTSYGQLVITLNIFLFVSLINMNRECNFNVNNIDNHQHYHHHHDNP